MHYQPDRQERHRHGCRNVGSVEITPASSSRIEPNVAVAVAANSDAGGTGRAVVTDAATEAGAVAVAEPHARAAQAQHVAAGHQYGHRPPSRHGSGSGLTRRAASLTLTTLRGQEQKPANDDVDTLQSGKGDDDGEDGSPGNKGVLGKSGRMSEEIDEYLARQGVERTPRLGNLLLRIGVPKDNTGLQEWISRRCCKSRSTSK